MTRFVQIFFLLAITTSLSACAIAEGMKLAVHCQTDEALAAISTSEQGSGVTANLAMLEHEAILRDAGRIEEADAIRAKRESDPNMTEKEKADAEKAVLDTIENLRNEREKQTGSRLCK